MEGWIKLHRKFSKWEWFNISEMVHLFIYLLLNANHEDGSWRGIEIKRGQILTGLNSLHQNTKISNQTLRTCLTRLEKTQEINTQVTNKYRIITICNYDDYQSIKDTTNKQPNKQLTTNKNKENEKNNNNTWRDDFQIYLSESKKGFIDFYENTELMKTQQRFNPGVNIKLTLDKAFTNYWGTQAGWKNKKASKSKNINWERTIINAISPINKVYYTKDELSKL